MKVCLGIDPDLHDTGLCIAAPDRVLAVGVIRVSSALKGDKAVLAMTKRLGEKLPAWLAGLRPMDGFNPASLDAVVVEGQQIYIGTSKAHPDAILRLGQVSGAALCVAQAACDPVHSWIPRPSKWKGTVPKQIHQGRILGRFGWRYERRGSQQKSGWCCPSDLGSRPLLSDVSWPGGCWKHIVDAMGLAAWGLKQIGEK